MSNKSTPRIIISGLRGGSGKTILSLSLIASWRKNGVKVTPFKKGPDYIDAGWLAKAAGNPCFNLDLFMMHPKQVVQSFISHTHNSQMAVVEGNRGLYDGVDYEGTYSTAELAKLLKAPVIIVVNCAKVTSTVAAMVLGCQRLDPGVPIKGVVLNNIGYARQEAVIRKAIDKKCRLPVLGAIPRLRKELFPERHMGLTPFQEHLSVEESISAITELGSEYLDVESIWEIAEKAEPFTIEDSQNTEYSRRRARSSRTQTIDSCQSSVVSCNGQQTTDNGPGTTKHKLLQGSDVTSSVITRCSRLKIGVIRDSAFQFYYPENFEELEKQRAEIVEISALREKQLPDVDALYIGGGFPETHAVALAENENFKVSLLKAIERGLPVYAECGGLMYLGKSLFLNNKTYPMVGVFPLVFGVEKKPQAHGYTIIEVERENPYFEKGCILKGHEFHYSRVIEAGESGTSMAFRVKRGCGIKDRMDGICYKNTLATYTHLHALGTGEWVSGLIRCASEFKNRRTISISVDILRARSKIKCYSSRSDLWLDLVGPIEQNRRNNWLF